MKGNCLHVAPVAWCLVLLLLLLGVTSCMQPNSSPLSGAALLEFQSHFMNSYNANSSTPVTAPSRATIPVFPSGTATFPTGESFTTLSTNSSATNTIHGYPAAGEDTSFGVSNTASASVYRIVATTTFPSNDARSTYVETYYVEDQTPGNASTPDGVWTNDDPVGSLSGSTFTTNSAARVSMTLTFANTDTRSEVIENNTTLYSFPDINGSMLLKALSQPVVDTSGLVTFSSVVGYVTKPTSLVQSPYWQSTSTPPNVVGLRYYSEQGGQWSSVSFERITAEDQDLSTLSFADLQSIIFTNKKNSKTFTTLGTSVLRENETTKNMQTLLVNNVQNLTYQLQLDSTGTIIYVLTANGQLIQAGL